MTKIQIHQYYKTVLIHLFAIFKKIWKVNYNNRNNLNKNSKFKKNNKLNKKMKKKKTINNKYNNFCFQIDYSKKIKKKKSQKQ